MVFGPRNAGEEFQAYLNRLAETTQVDAQGAANLLAGTTNLDLLGALNVAAGTTALEYQGALEALALAEGGGGGGGEAGGVTDRVVVSRVATGLAANNATWLDIAYDTEVVDVSDYWVSGSPTRITVPADKAGYHFFSFYWAITQGVSGERSMGDLRVFNSSGVAQNLLRGPIGEGAAGSSLSMLCKLADGDYVTSHIWRQSASITIPANGARMEVVRFE